MTTSIKDVRHMFDTVKSAVIESGYSRTVTNMEQTQTLTGADLYMQEGSQTYGRAFRLYLLGPYGAHYTFDIEYLGWTRAEAYQTLRGIIAGIRLGK